MKEGLNRVQLMGTLGADSELRFTHGGQAVLNMRLATNETYLDKDKVRREKTEWHNVVLWGKRAEALSKFLEKGRNIFVEGSLHTSSYDARDGNKRYKTEINANNVILLPGAERARAAGDASRTTSKSVASGARDVAKAAAATMGIDYDESEYGGGSDDEIPF